MDLSMKPEIEKSHERQFSSPSLNTIRRWPVSLLAVFLLVISIAISIDVLRLPERARAAGPGLSTENSGTPATLAPAVWPQDVQYYSLSDIGRGKAIVFSPDFSAPGNRKFYQGLGFTYFEEADWQNIISQIIENNYSHP